MTLNIPALSTNNYFQDMTRYVYGLDISAGTPTQATITAANKLWNEFLTTQGLTQDTFKQAIGYQESTHTASNTGAVEKYTTLYNEFVTKQLSYLYESQAANLSTLNEQESRDIIFKTFSLVLQMLSVLQKSMQESSDALVFYTKLQQQYTEMLKHIPLYALNPTYAHQFQTTDYGNALLSGYGNITVSNAINYLLSKLVVSSSNFTKAGTTTETLTSPTLGFFTPRVKLSYSAGRLICTVEVYNISRVYETLSSSTLNISGKQPTDVMQQATGQLINNTNFTQSVLTECQSAWMDFIWPPDSTKPSVLPEKTDATHPVTKFDEDKQRQQQRAEVNAKLQLYISNAQANRDLAQSQSKPMENLVNQTREAIQAQMTLIDNLVSLLKGLLGAVTRS